MPWCSSWKNACWPLVPGSPQTSGPVGVAGTPPFVPPEAVYAQPLDARCDIFALGALAYYLLTKHNAYPAREIADLQRVWERQPQRPDANRPDVPPALRNNIAAFYAAAPDRMSGKKERRRAEKVRRQLAEIAKDTKEPRDRKPPRTQR